MPFYTAVIYSEEAVHHYRKWGFDHNEMVHRATHPYEFDSQAETVAFLEGVKDGIANLKAEIDPVPNEALISKIAFVGLDNAFRGVIRRGHATPALRQAYEQGVSEGVPHRDFLVVTGEDLEQFLSDVGWC